jgi:DNA repair exonuclease SbcCD ATPase subunit
MLKLKRLKFENLGRFVGTNTIDFESKSNFIQIDAENMNTGGSSGGGKSSIFLALEYAMGINDVPSTVLQSRLTKSPLFVEIELEKNNETFTISRHRTEGLSINGPGVSVSGSTKEAEDTLDRILGIPRSLLRPMFHKRQGEGGFFLSKTPKQSHDFLMECLGMNLIEQKISKAEARLKALEQSLSVKTPELSSYTSSLESTESFISSMQPPKCDVDEDVLLRLIDKINFFKAQKEQVVGELSTKLSSLGSAPSFSYQEDPRLAEVIRSQESEINLLTQKLMEAHNHSAHLISTIKVDENHVSIHQQAIQKKSLIQKDLEDIGRQISEALTKICPTCKQGLGSDQVSHSIASPLVEKGQKKKSELEAIIIMEEKLPIISAAIEKNKEILSHTENLKNELSQTLQKAKDNLSLYLKAREEAKNGALSHYRTVTEAFEKDKRDLNDHYAPIISSIESQMEAYNQAFYKGQANLKAFQESVKKYEEQKQLAESRLTGLREGILKLQNETLDISKEISLASGSVKLLKSYANQLFQESLAIVAETATRILSRIPNMSTGTITFDAYKETKAGGLKEEVVAILSIDDEINVPVKSMSGGERAAIDLAVDLAVIEMIENRTGNGLDLFVLDEPFDGFDAICRENCLEVLKNHASDRKIVIVDHSTETKEMVRDKILVVREGQTSRISDSI